MLEDTVKELNVAILVTSRRPDDIPAFNRETIKLFSGARGQRHAA